MADEINYEVTDNYLEHELHTTYDKDCSTCFKQVQEFDKD